MYIQKTRILKKLLTYLKKRNVHRTKDKISIGKNPEVEKRYDRYVDYG